MDHSPSPLAETLTRRVREMISAGRIGAARPLLSALQRMGGDESEMSELRARLLMKEGHLPDALAAVDQGVAAAPQHVGLRLCRAELRLHSNDPVGAAADAAEAVVLDRTDPVAKATLGFALLELRQTEDALVCFTEAANARPNNESIARGLAEAQERGGDVTAAAATLAKAIAFNPKSLSLRNAAILLAVRQRDFDAALELAETARRAGLVDACIFGLKGHALSNLGRHDEAAEAYAEALKLGPEDPYVRHLVAASGALPGSDRAPLPYVRAVFNNYAEGFESHLISLSYRVPGLVRKALLEALPMPTSGKPLGPVLDLGCGTGLAAVVLADLPVGPFIGVDISPGMLAQAQGKQLYAELREQDVLAALGEETRRYPVILAADVFCYFGALEEVFARVHARMQPGGVFIFSVETLLLEKENATPARQRWTLGPLGRYAHAPSYIEACAEGAGFRVRAMHHEALRQEGLEPVQGLILTLERVRADG